MKLLIFLSQIQNILDIKKLYDKAKSILEKEGLAPIKAVDERFDPYKHEAVMSVTTGKHPENTVVEELQRGYSLKSKVIRPALVKVAKR